MIKSIYQKLFNQSLRKKIAYLRSNLSNPKGLPEDVLLFKRRRVIFIHIPKAAGISLYKAIYQRDSFGHETIQHYENFMSSKEFNECYKFTFVRNPYDRIHSAFYYLKAGGRNRPFDIEYSQQLSSIKSFEEFVLSWLNIENLYKIQHFCPQVYYLKNSKNEINLDFIGKFEFLETDFRTVAEELEIDKELLFLNKTKTNKSNYKDEYSKQMVKIVDDLYHEDFKLLGYQKMEL